MIEISLTQFVDFVIKAGSPKLTVVRTIKKQHDRGYSPAADFYKSIREKIVEFHREGKPISALGAIAIDSSDKKKRTAYPAIVQGYRRFLGRKAVNWFDPPRRRWKSGELTVRVNPELGLSISGSEYVIKMYWKGQQLRKQEVPAILHLMQAAVGMRRGATSIALLDVRRGRLITPTEFDPSMLNLLKGEALSFVSMYKALANT